MSVYVHLLSIGLTDGVFTIESAREIFVKGYSIEWF